MRLPLILWLVFIASIGVLVMRRQVTVTLPGEIQYIIATPTPGGPQELPLPTATPVGSGGTLAFSMRHQGNSDLYLLSQTTGRLVRLTYDPAADRDPSWSPDSKWLAFASNRAHNWDLYLMEMNSNTVVRLTRNPVFEAGPTWSPDGQWLAYESYEGNNLNIHITSIDGKQTYQLTSDPAPDYSPSWSPDGRHIVFTSFRNGNKDLYLFPLDKGEEAVINLTNTPNVDEDHGTWSPDGSYLTYATGTQGDESLWLLPFDREGMSTDLGAEMIRPLLFGFGGAPAWSPDGKALAFITHRQTTSFLVAASVEGFSTMQGGFNTQDWIDHPSWTRQEINNEAIGRLEARMQDKETPLYVELLTDSNAQATHYQLVGLPNVNNGNGVEKLSDKVNDSFNALRRRIVEETGWDYFAILGDSSRSMNHTPRPGQGRISWHVCGRAVDINQGFLRQGLAELSREDVGGVTYWRIFIKAREQDGTLGEPLRVAPWDLEARNKGGEATTNGGELKAEIPNGYYIDYTALASDYGWERRNALSNWRTSYFDIEWWHYQKTEGMSWYDCMLELYSSDAVSASYGVLPWWTKLPEWKVASMP